MSTTTKKRRYRRLRYRYWQSKSNGLWYAHIKSGAEIVFPTEGIERQRDVLKPAKMLTKFFADPSNLVIERIEDPNFEAGKLTPAEIRSRELCGNE